MSKVLLKSKAYGNLPSPIRALGAAASLALFLAACGEPSGAPEESADSGSAATNLFAASETTLRVGNGAEPDSLDPHRATGTWESTILGDIMMGLMTEDVEGNAIPGSAESYEVSEDGKTYTFKIREGMLWSDGVPVTAEDFSYAFRRILKPETAAQYASLLYVIKNAEKVNTGQIPPAELGVTALDERTLEILLENPAPYFLEMLTHQTTYPVPKHKVEELGDKWIRDFNFVGNGPFKLAEWVPQSYVHVVKNELFYDAENVKLQDVVFIPTVDTSAALKMFRAGELDYNRGAPLQQIDWMKENLKDEFIIFPYMGVSYIQINTKLDAGDHPGVAEGLANPKVRLALSMALEREVMTDKILNAGQIPAYSFIPPGISNYKSEEKMSFEGVPIEQRIEMAKQLLADAGFGPDNPLVFEYKYREGVDGKRLAMATRAMWQKIGVTANLLKVEVKTHYEDLRVGNFEVADAGWIADYNDAQNFFFLLQTSTGQMNYGKYSNPVYDSLIDEANQTLDLNARSDLMRQAERIVLDEQPLMPTYFASSQTLKKDYVKGWVPNVSHRHRSRYVYIDNSM